ncbi:MAG: hypothetical protein N3G20_10940, partial [Verrucomicrobiae bacterium]|nr:hypothetical protein [Verrucomicrobiae bacterium]
ETGLGVIAIGLAGNEYRWLVSLLILAGFAFLARREQRDLQRLIGVFMDRAAEDLGLRVLDGYPGKRDPKTGAGPFGRLRCLKGFSTFFRHWP